MEIRMTSRGDLVSVGVLAIVIGLLLNGAAFVLQATFRFPDILRRPAAEALEQFTMNAPAVMAAYYVFALTSLLQGALVLGIRRLNGRRSSLALDIATAAGLGMALVQTMGFLRWVFMEPALVQLYRDGAGEAGVQSAVLAAHETMNRFAGVAIGEHLGWLLLATWLVATGVHMRVTPTLSGGRVGGGVAIVCGVLTLVSTVEQFGVVDGLQQMAFYGGYVAYTVLLIPFGVRLLRLAARLDRHV
ncbi:MAG TPA: hypothetical protein VE861_16325 [Gemmatimonadaceae bacterium]|nr:hypothetical protein [Gemmatimonadaceae bacterium]